MTAPVHTLTLSVTVKTAILIMLDHEINAMPVVDEQAHLLGMASSLDLVILAGLDMLDLKLGEVPLELKLNKTVLTVRQDELIKTALLKIARHKVGRLVVLDQSNRCAGIVSRTDLMKYFVDTQHGLTRSGRSEEA